AVGFADDKAAWRVDLVQRHCTALTAGKRRNAGWLLIVIKPLPILLLGDEALGSGISQGIGAIAGKILQCNGQMPRPRMVGHEYDPLTRQLLQYPVTATAQLLALSLQPLDFLLQLRVQLVAVGQFDVAN